MKIKTNKRLTEIISTLDHWASSTDYNRERYSDAYDAYTIIGNDGIFLFHTEGCGYNNFEDYDKLLHFSSKYQNKEIYKVHLPNTLFLLFAGDIKSIMKKVERRCKERDIDIGKLLKGEYENKNQPKTN